PGLRGPARHGREGRDRTVLDIVDQLSIQVAADARTGQLDSDIVPAARLDLSGHVAAERDLGAVGAFLEAMLPVSPAADVPPEVVLRVFRVEQDQETLGAAELARLQMERVILGVAQCRLD